MHADVESNFLNNWPNISAFFANKIREISKSPSLVKFLEEESSKQQVQYSVFVMEFECNFSSLYNIIN